MKFSRKILFVTFIAVFIWTLFAQEKSPELIAQESIQEGRTLFVDKKFDEALVKFQLALENYQKAKTDEKTFDNELRTLYNVLYNVAGQAKKIQLAVEYGLEYLNFDSANENMVNNIANLMVNQLNRGQDAVTLWTNYDEMYNSYVAKQKIADIYEKAKDLPNAIIWYRKALEMNMDADLLRKLANLYLESKQQDRAIAVYEDYIKTNPSQRDLGRTYRNIAALYQNMNNNSKAIEYNELFLSIEFDRSIALWLVNNYYDKNDFTNAEKHIGAMLAKNASDHDAIYYKAMALYKQEKMPEAKKEFQKLVNHTQYGKNAQDFIKIIDQK